MESIKIKGKEYVMVHQRILSLKGKKYSIKTKARFHPDHKMWVVRAVLTLFNETYGTNDIYTGHAQEIIDDGYINKTSALENCETSAVGRALGMAGIGIDTGFASADEVKKAVDREGHNESAATIKQLSLIDSLLRTSTLPNADGLYSDMREYTKKQASKMISELKDSQQESLTQEFDRKTK